MKLSPLALIYSLVMNASMKLLSVVPFTSRFRIGVEKLHPKDCFVPKLSAPDDATNPVCIVTGSNTGVGFQTATALVERGYDVILACRSREKGETAAQKINDKLASLDAVEGEGKALFLHPLDLSSFQSVRSFCKVFTEKYSSLNILCNNAGINHQGDTTEDGLEICFQSNFVGHFLLTKLLLGHLLKAKNKYQTEGGQNGEEAGRIVNLSSVTHHYAPANERPIVDNVDESAKSVPLDNNIHDKMFWLSSAMCGLSAGTYRESKLASILFTMELNKRYGSKGIRSIAANPGSVSSDIWRNESKLKQKIYSMVYLTTQQGSSTSIAAAVGVIPVISKDAFYIQPYWQPRSQAVASNLINSSFRQRYKLPFPVTEMLGPYVGHAVTEPRLPNDGYNGYESSNALWEVCDKLTSSVN